MFPQWNSAEQRGVSVHLSDHSDAWQRRRRRCGGGGGAEVDGDGDYDCRLTVLTLELYRGGGLFEVVRGGRQRGLRVQMYEWLTL